MAKEYIVGLDYGHGETAAWIVPISAGSNMETKGESLRLKSTNTVNDRVMHSVVYHTPDGNFSLDKAIGSSIIGKMKGRVSDLNKKPEMKEAYKAYIKLIVEALIKHNSSLLTLNGDDGKPNFYICMASPTKWNDRDKAEYLQFFNDAIAELGLTFEWIINESDAAFFSHRDVVNHNELTLVIDYGSSTLDYTVMYQGKKVSEDEWSNDQLGAGKIERTIMNSYRAQDYEGFQNSYNGTAQLLASTGNSHIDIDSALDYNCRLVKEDSYTQALDNTAIEYHLGDLSGLTPQLRKFRFEYDFCLSEITADYRELVENDIKELKAKIEQKTGRQVQKVILSGGACIMNWVGAIAIKLFPNAQIIDDRNPSFVVARGIALYAQSQQNALNEILNAIDSEDFGATFSAADNQATKDAIRELSGNAVEEARKQINCIKMVDVFGEYIQHLDNNNSAYVASVQSKVRAAVTQKVRDALKKAFNKNFKWDIDVSAVNIDVVVDCAPWNPSMFTYNVRGQEVNIEKTGLWSQTIMVAIQNILKRHKFLFTTTDWTKDRSVEERNYLANELIDEVLKETDWLDTVTYGEDNSFLKHIDNAIRTQAREYATKIFFDNQLFRTTFSK